MNEMIGKYLKNVLIVKSDWVGINLLISYVIYYIKQAHNYQ